MTRRFHLTTEDDTIALGASLAALAQPGVVITLTGPLGAGKTCLARGLIKAMKPTDADEIVSPTFTIVQTYETETGAVWHFDLYRLKHPDEAIEIGFEDALQDICLIEWPDRLGGFLPADRIDVVLRQADAGRAAEVVGQGRRGDDVAKWTVTLLEESV